MFRSSFASRSILAALFVCAGHWFAAAGAYAFQDDYFRVVDIAGGDALNIRSGPSTNARIVGAIPSDGRGIEHLASGAGSPWALVRFGGVKGWAPKARLAAQIEDGAAAGYDIYEVTGVTRVRRNDVLNVRSLPSFRARKIAKLAPDAAGVSIIRRHRNGWALISFEGSRGWVNARYLAPVAY